MELKDKAEKFEKDVSKLSSIKRTWKVYSKFIKSYPYREKPGEIDKITPEKLYTPGTPDYFFTWVEHRLKDFGHLRIGSAKVWENAKESVEKFKELLKIIVDRAKPVSEKIDAHWEDISGFGGDRHIAKKILFLYHPQKIIPIFKTEDFEYFVDKFGGDYHKKSYEKYGRDYDLLTVGQKFELFNNMLLEIKNKDDTFRSWDNAMFTRFLYDYVVPPRPLEKGAIGFLTPYGLVSEPTTEQEVVFLFSKFHKELGFPTILKIGTSFPDATALDRAKGVKRIEFEIYASGFNHDPKGCDYIVCWENDLNEEQTKKLPLVISLKDKLMK